MIASDSGWGDNKKTCFIDVTVWGKQAEFVAQNFSKGDGIFIEGRLDFDRWKDKNSGDMRSKHRITVERVTFPVGNRKKTGLSDTPPADSSGWNSNEIDEIPF